MPFWRCDDRCVEIVGALVFQRSISIVTCCQWPHIIYRGLWCMVYGLCPKTYVVISSFGMYAMMLCHSDDMSVGEPGLLVSTLLSV